jgi:hypothetical protein
MTNITHELMILDSIETAAYCTECFEDYLSCALTEVGRHFLCFKCYDAARQRVVAAQAKVAAMGQSSKPRSDAATA